MKRRTIIIGGIVSAAAVVGLLLFVVGPLLRPPPELNVRRGKAEAGTILVTISAAGKVEPEQRASLSFSRSGAANVTDVKVEVGDRVRASQQLGREETGLLDISVEQAQLLLEIQELSNQRLLEPASESDLKAALAAISAAGARYSSLAADPEEVEVARLEAEQAQFSFTAAELNRNGANGAVSAGFFRQSQADIATAQAGIAWVQTEILTLQYQQLLEGPNPQALGAAGAEIGVARADLALLEEGPTELMVERSVMQLQQAQVAFDRAEEDLRGAILVAPFDGIIAVVNIKERTPAPIGVAAIEMIDDSKFHIDVDVDEIDIGRVQEGQAVSVVLDALPGQVLSGTVVAISPSANSTSGIVSYNVRVDIDTTEAPLRTGMTATVDIVVRQEDEVLRVPNWAIRIDRRSGNTFVNIQGPDDSLLEIEVELGLRGDAYSEIASGLSEGDEVLVNLDRDELSFFGGEE